MVGHAGEADRAEEDRVEAAELVEAVLGHHLPGLRVALAAPVEPRQLEPKPRGAAASRTRPSGSTSLPIPSPGITAMRYRFVIR